VSSSTTIDEQSAKLVTMKCLAPIFCFFEYAYSVKSLQKTNKRKMVGESVRGMALNKILTV